MKLKLTNNKYKDTQHFIAKQIALMIHKAFNPDEHADCSKAGNDFSFLEDEGYFHESNGRYFYYTHTGKFLVPCNRYRLTSFSATKSSKSLALMALLTKLNETMTDYVVFQLDVIEGEPNLEFSLYYQNCHAATDQLRALRDRLMTMELSDLDVEL